MTRSVAGTSADRAQLLCYATALRFGGIPHRPGFGCNRGAIANTMVCQELPPRIELRFHCLYASGILLAICRSVIPISLGTTGHIKRVTAQARGAIRHRPGKHASDSITPQRCFRGRSRRESRPSEKSRGAALADCSSDLTAPVATRRNADRSA
jgi:hypothetical protein